jgi:hypothetical protein
MKDPKTTEYTRQDVKTFRWQYRALVINGDRPGFEALLGEYGKHLSAEQKKQAIETFMRDAEKALRFRWRASK